MLGYLAYAYVNEGKLEPRAKKCIYMGYQGGVKGIGCGTLKNQNS